MAPRASLTGIAVLRFLKKKTLSIESASGLCLPISRMMDECMRSSLFSCGRSLPVLIQPYSRHCGGTPRAPPLRSTPYPVIAVPGSMPKISIKLICEIRINFLHDVAFIQSLKKLFHRLFGLCVHPYVFFCHPIRSEEHTSEVQSH